MAKKKEGVSLSTILGVGAMLYVGVHFHIFSAISAANPDYFGKAAYHSGTLTCKKLESLWVRAGGRRPAAFMAAEVAKAESGGRQYATNYDSNRTVDRGYWQINSTHGSESSFDPLTNARAAVSISDNGRNWSAWVTYNNGAEVGQC